MTRKNKSLPQLVKCPLSCLIHVCHNSFHRGLSQYGNNVEELCLALCYFFKCSSCRRQDLFEIEDSLGLECIMFRVIDYHWFLHYSILSNSKMPSKNCCKIYPSLTYVYSTDTAAIIFIVCGFSTFIANVYTIIYCIYTYLSQVLFILYFLF